MTAKPNKWTVLTVTAGVLALGGLLYMFDPAKAPFPTCLFHKLTGLQCPGCGTQRALHSLLHLDLKAAFLYNPILIPALALVAALLYLNSFGGKRRFPKLYRRLSGSAFIWSLLGVIILYWIGRNFFNAP